MTVSVQEKIEQIKHKKYAYQWDIHLKAHVSFSDAAFDRILLTLSDIFDHVSSGPAIQRPHYLGRGGKEIYAIDFSLTNAWGNGLYFHFYDRGGNPRDGFGAQLWCEFVGIADTRLWIEQSATVYYRFEDDGVVTVEPNTTLRISLATNQGWAWQEAIWRAIRERFSQEGYDDETLGMQSRVRLLDTIGSLGETDVFEKLFAISTEKVMQNLNHPVEYDQKYFVLRSDRYIDIEQTIRDLKDPGRIRTIDISSLGLEQIPEQVALFPYVKDMYAESNEFVVFPEVITKMHTIERLLLGYNHVRTIPKTIAQLQNLTFLHLSNNEIDILPEQIGLLQNLESLHIAYNKLTSLPQSLEKLEKLRMLRLTGNPLPPEEIAKVKRLLPHCQIETEKTHYERSLDGWTAKFA